MANNWKLILFKLFSKGTSLALLALMVRPKNSEPSRALAICVGQRQGHIFSHTSQWLHIETKIFTHQVIAKSGYIFIYLISLDLLFWHLEEKLIPFNNGLCNRRTQNHFKQIHIIKAQIGLQSWCHPRRLEDVNDQLCIALPHRLSCYRSI